MDKATAEKNLETAKDLTEELIEKLGIEANVDAFEKDGAICVDIEGEDLGLLIGYHGENLEGLQLLLGLMVNKKIKSEEWQPVNLDIGGWRKERLEILKSMVDKAAADIDSSRDSVELPPMPASQRRTVHVLLGDHPNLTSESVGEEPNRKVVIKKA